MQKSTWRWWLGMSVGLLAGVAAGCAGEEDDGDGVFTSGDPGPGGSGGAAADGGGGAGGESLCAQDCSEIETPPCLESICNDGSQPGQVGACVVVNAATGTACDDGLFCTVDDFCDAGECTGGPQNTCGDVPPACTVVTCDEGSQTCSTAPSEDGDPCVLTTLCEVAGECTGGECVGVPKDCTFSPLSECNSNLVCDPLTGECGGSPDPAKNGDPCSLTGDQCNVGKTCNNGACEGGTPKDCAFLTVDCFNGVCNPQTGGCVQEVVPAGGTCFDGITECNTGTCDAAGACVASAVPDGGACNDFNSCTGGDECNAGVCEGSPVVGCEVYFEEGFEACPPPGWTLGTEWECGAPSVVGPASAHTGNNVVATNINGNYSDDLAFATSYAQSAPIDLTTTTEPVLVFWAWVDTEVTGASAYDGFNVKISTNNGASFVPATEVSPPYDITIASELAWGGHLGTLGYQQYTADLSSFVGQQVVLQFAFRSDVSNVFPGVYIDDVQVMEASIVPLLITTPPTLPSPLQDNAYTVDLMKSGGSSGSTWAIVGGTNHGWLSVDPATGELVGTPTAANAGPGNVTVRVSEPSLPSNFDEFTLDFTVLQPIVAFNFDGVCPNGWTLTGDWQCGSPTVVGPTGAYSGAQLIGTQLAADYSAGMNYATCYAQSPALDLTGSVAPELHFHAYVDTERFDWDGFNVKVSTDGVAFTTITTVTPAYDKTVATEPAWGGQLAAAGFAEYVVDLGAFAGQSIFIRFAFDSDGSNQFSGVYIDDVYVID